MLSKKALENLAPKEEVLQMSQWHSLQNLLCHLIYKMEVRMFDL